MSGGSAFSRGGALALVLGGFALFLALLWLIGAGSDFGGDRNAGKAHASANGLNGYSGFARLVEAEGYHVERSRSPADLETYGLLVLTPGVFGDGKEVGEILTKRRFIGPTLVIMPKWSANPPGPNIPAKAKARFKKGWVILGGPEPSEWPEVLPTGYQFRHKLFPEPAVPMAAIELDPQGRKPVLAPGTPETPAASPPPPPPPPARWSGMDLVGVLPTDTTLYAEPGGRHQRLITDAKGRVLAFGIGLDDADAPAPTDKDADADEDGAYAPQVQPVIVLAEPDLANNYGLADPARAAAAMALVEELTYGGEIDEVTFDMTLAGFGASENLLTLAFRPPFLAATLSLLVALLIVGWRAFQRFGPAASARGPDIAFGKRQLIANGAGLIIRARRFRLLAAPYAALSARRLAERLGLARPDPEAIDQSLARRLPGEEPFTRRAARLEAASRPADILAAAQSLDELATKITQGQSSA